MITADIAYDSCRDIFFISGSIAQPWTIGDLIVDSLSLDLIGQANSSSTTNSTKYAWEGSIKGVTAVGAPLDGAFALSAAFSSKVAFILSPPPYILTLIVAAIICYTNFFQQGWHSES